MKKKLVQIFIFLLISTMLSSSVYAAPDLNNGEWSQKTISSRNTDEAQLMVRVGDIDNLGFGFDEGYNPFTAEETSRHKYPWNPDDSEPQGTDRIMLGSSYKGDKGRDGYSKQYTIDPLGTKIQPIAMNYDASGINVENALLQLYIDDFQAPVWGSKFTATINNKNAPFIAEIINSMVQTGPIGYIISAEIPKSFFDDIASGKLEIVIDDKTTGLGDGFAIDFAKLLVNYKDSAFKGTISGTVKDKQTGKPIQGATVRVLGTSTTITTSANGNYVAEVIAGMNVVRASKDGYKENYQFGPVPAEKTVTFKDISLTKGVGTPDIDYYSFAKKTGWSNASAWATQELQKAYDLGLIPECLVGADMTKNITRAEFAAVAVRLYEVMGGKAAKQAAENPFKDTTDSDVLKAYNNKIVMGISATSFEPNSLLNREQASTMLARTIKAVYPDVVIDAAGSTPFADDEKISDWAKSSVYFMAKNAIIGGMGNNIFGPKNITSIEIAEGYANATREQAILIATRSFEKFNSNKQ